MNIKDLSRDELLSRKESLQKMLDSASNIIIGDANVIVAELQKEISAIDEEVAVRDGIKPAETQAELTVEDIDSNKGWQELFEYNKNRQQSEDEVLKSYLKEEQSLDDMNKKLQELVEKRQEKYDKRITGQLDTDSKSINEYNKEIIELRKKIDQYKNDNQKASVTPAEEDKPKRERTSKEIDRGLRTMEDTYSRLLDEQKEAEEKFGKDSKEYQKAKSKAEKKFEEILARGKEKANQQAKEFYNDKENLTKKELEKKYVGHEPNMKLTIGDEFGYGANGIPGNITTAEYITSREGEPSLRDGAWGPQDAMLRGQIDGSALKENIPAEQQPANPQPTGNDQPTMGNDPSLPTGGSVPAGDPAQTPTGDSTPAGDPTPTPTGDSTPAEDPTQTPTGDSTPAEDPIQTPTGDSTPAEDPIQTPTGDDTTPPTDDENYSRDIDLGDFSRFDHIELKTVQNGANGEEPNPIPNPSDDEEYEQVEIYQGYVTEVPGFTTGRGMSEEEIKNKEKEYIKEFEEATGIEFDPNIHTLRYNYDSYDDGYDNPVSTWSIVEKRKLKTKTENKNYDHKYYEDMLEELETRKAHDESIFGDLADDQLDDMLESLNAEYENEYYNSVHLDNGMEANEFTRIDELNELKEEIKRRERLNDPNNQFKGMPTDDLENMYNEYLDNLDFGDDKKQESTDEKRDYANARQVFINDKQTQEDVTFDPNHPGEISDGVYYNLEDIVNALNEELSKIGPNETIVCKETGEVVTGAEVINKVIEEAMKDEKINLNPEDTKIDYKSYGLKFENPGEEALDKGIVNTDKEETAKTGYYVKGDTVKDIIDKYKIEKGPKKPPFDVTERDRLVAEWDADMLDKFWGNKEKEKRYRAGIAEYKSHIITLEDGTQTVEDFEGKEELERFLQLEEFKDRIEAYSLYEKRKDPSKYLERLEHYKKIGAPLPRKEDGSLYTDDEYIDMFIKDDKQYISTYNNAYNRLQVSYYNWKTLGKYGEKTPTFKMEPRRDENGKFQTKVFVKNLGHAFMNIAIFGRNYISAPIHKAIGTLVVAPLYKLITKADERTAGLYSNKRSHRYAAAREYFQQQYLEEWYRKRAEKGKPSKQFGGLFASLKMLATVRKNALMFADEAYSFILETGHQHNYETATHLCYMRELEKEYKKSLVERKEFLKQQSEELELKLQQQQSEEEKQQTKDELEKIHKEQAEINKELESSTKALSLMNTQNDAVDLSVHNKANKDNITHIVTVAETAAKIVGAKWLSKNLKKWITEKQIQNTPGHYENVPGDSIDPSKGQQLSNQAVVDTSGKHEVYHTAYYDGMQSYNYPAGNESITGIVSPRQSTGLRYSSSTIASNTAIPHSTTTITQNIPGLGSFFETQAQNLSKGMGKTVTALDIINDLNNSPNTKQAFLDFVANSSFEINGQGWIRDLNGAELWELVATTEKIWVPGTQTVITTTRQVIDPLKVAGLGAIIASTGDNIYNEVRETRSEEYQVDNNLRKGPVEDERRKTREPYQVENPNGIREVGFTGDREGDYEAWRRKFETTSPAPTSSDSGEVIDNQNVESQGGRGK